MEKCDYCLKTKENSAFDVGAEMVAKMKNGEKRKFKICDECYDKLRKHTVAKK